MMSFIERILVFPHILVFLNTDMMDNMIIDLNYTTLLLHILMIGLNRKGYLFCRFEDISFGDALDRENIYIGGLIVCI